MSNHTRPKNKALQELAELRTRLRVVEKEVEQMSSGSAALETVIYDESIGRERTEAALRESEERYLALFNAIEQGFCTIEVSFDEHDRPLDYRFLEVSPSFERQTGIPNAAGRWMRDIAADQDEHWFELYGGVALTGTPAKFESFSSPLRRWWSVYAFRIRAPELRRIGVLFHDITERKRSEEALRAARVRLASTLTAAEIGIWHWDMASDCLTGDENFLRIFGFSNKFEEGAPLSEYVNLIHEEDRSRVAAAIEAVQEAGGRYSEEYRIVRADGSVRWVHARGLATISADGRLREFPGILVDITVRKESEVALLESTAQLIAAKEEAERANNTKDEFIAALSHELRTPLTPVLLAVQSLQEDAALLPATRDELRMIQHNVSLEVQLIDDLLDLTRIARGKLQITPSPMDAEAVLRRAIETSCGEEIRSQSTHVHFDFRATATRVHADEARLSQVFWNVAKNAMKFTAHGGTVTIQTRNPTPDTFQVRILDDGIGINAEKLHSIFDAFEQGGSQINRQFGGLGLGLAISRVLVEMHHGRITAHSAGEGRGAEFTIDLPLLKTGEIGRGEKLPRQPQEEGARTNGLRLLLVEDHPDSARTLKSLLTRKGHEVLLAGTAAEALQVARHTRLDLVVSDLGLPDASGHDLMKELRDTHGLKGIALSGYGMEEDRRRSLEAGFIDHLVKPIEMRQLQDLLGQFKRRGE